MYTKDIGKIMKKMVKVFIDLVAAMFMKDFLKMECKVEREFTESITERITEEIMTKEDYMVKVGLHFKTEIFRMPNGKTERFRRKWCFMIVNHKEQFIDLIF